MSLFFSSLTRISDLPDVPFSIEPIPRGQWGSGDYVVGEVMTRASPNARVELRDGRMTDLVRGDRVVGALGVRTATLEVVGDWNAIGQDGRMHALTTAGLLGRATSVSTEIGLLVDLDYMGHVSVDGRKATMADYVENVPDRPLDLPVVMVVGTSMSAGKTTTARILIRILKEMGVRIVGAKLTGAGRYRDILAMKDAGADFVLDFVDQGLPSTACPADEYRPACRQLISRIAAAEADVAVIEVGASPVEPYNSDLAIHEIAGNIRATVLCVADPYAVLGVISAFKIEPDLVTGVATSTGAGTGLITRLSGFESVNVLAADSWPVLRRMLKRKLEL
jgi:hypothetical protein